MALNIKNPEVERLATEVAEMAKESKTEAIRRALEERKVRLRSRGTQRDKTKRLIEYLERYVWPTIPPELRGKGITKEEREKILGYGPQGF
jgi:antitoxin VapB